MILVRESRVVKWKHWAFLFVAMEDASGYGLQLDQKLEVLRCAELQILFAPES